MKWCSLSTLVRTVSAQHENRSHSPRNLGKTPPRGYRFLSHLTVCTHVFSP